LKQRERLASFARVVSGLPVLFGRLPRALVAEKIERFTDRPVRRLRIVDLNSVAATRASDGGKNFT